MNKRKLLAIAEISKESGRKLDNLVADLRAKGFIGSLSRAMPYHIQLASFPILDVESVVARLHKTTTENYAFEVSYECIGIMNDLLFLIPSFAGELASIHNSIALKEEVHWIPKTPILKSDPKEIMRAVESLNRSFAELSSNCPGKVFTVSIDTIGIYESSPIYLVDRAKLLEVKILSSDD